MAGKIFKGIYWLGLLAEIVIRMPHDRQRRKNQIAVEEVTVQEKGLVSLIFVGMLLAPMIYSLTPWLKRADYKLSEKAQSRLGNVGVLFLSAALWIFYRAHADLGRNWSPTLQIREDHDLVTDGIYSRIRHPMYSSQLLWSVAQPLLMQNWIAGWGSLIPFLGLLLVRVPQEERMMLEQFDETYRAYMLRTGRIFPKIRS